LLNEVGFLLPEVKFLNVWDGIFLITVDILRIKVGFLHFGGGLWKGDVGFLRFGVGLELSVFC
jgi:hypothetical protein